ncbi:MAG: MBL fold metallo-hydrolase [Luteolibacter sp.]
MFLRQIPDHALAQYAYLIGCQRTGEAIIIDPERDVDRYFEVAAANDLRITAVAETHIHADYLSGARELVERHGAVAFLGEEGGPDWQFEWAKGKSAVRFLKHGDEFHVGNIRFKALHTPGHTPEHVSFLVWDDGGGADQPIALLTGDFIFVGDVGRPDLLESAAGQAGAMEPSARTLYASLRGTAELPDHLQILPAHGAGSACGKALGAVPVSVLGYERKFNAPLREAMNAGEDAFVSHILHGQPEPPKYFARMKRDNKEGPKLLSQGKLPQPDALYASGLAAWLEAVPTAILDLRADANAFAARHLRGAIHAPLKGGKLPIAAGSYLEDDARILLVAESQSEVDEAVRQLVRIGYDHIAGWITVVEALASDAKLEKLKSMDPKHLSGGLSVLDVRGAGEFAAGHVKGAVNIAHTRLAARIYDLPKGDTLHVHCAGGARAAMAASFLASTGRDVVWMNGRFADIPESLIGH